MNYILVNERDEIIPGNEMNRVVFLHESAQFTHHSLLTVAR